MRIPTFLVCLMTGLTPAVAKECRMPDVPPGVQVQVPPECKDRVRTRQPEAKKPDAVRADQGFIDLGSGTQIRFGGRVRGEVGVSP